MKILFLFTYLLLIFSFLIKFRSENKQNLILWLHIIIILLMSFYAFSAFCASFFFVFINLLFFSIVNILLTLLILLLVKKEKRIQNYYINKLDVYFVILLIISIFFLCIHLYTKDLLLKFETTDPAVHYLMAKEYVKNDSLLFIKNNSYPYIHLSKYPFLTYLNTGIFINLFNDVLYDYQLYIVFNLIIYYLISVIFYFILKKVLKHIVFSFILVVIFFLGYPLNAILFGFSSQLTGILLFLTSILLFLYYDVSLTKTNELIIINSIGLFFCYYYYIPEYLVALFLSTFILNYKKHNYTFFDSLKKCIFISIPTVILGIIYLISFNNL